MVIRHSKHIALGILAVVSMVAAGCTRSVAGNPIPSATPASGTSGELTGPEATMEAVRSAILTQTAVAAGGIGGGENDTATPSGPVATPTLVPSLAPTSTPTPAVPTTYTVQQGDWIYAIARKFNLDPDALIAANPGIDPNHIEPGQVLNLPAPGDTTGAPAGTALARPATYTVQKGEWVYSIARKFGVDPNAIISANNLQPPNYTVYPGQVLTIP